MIKTTQIIVIIVFILLFCLAIAMRIMPVNAENYHIDPLTKGVKGNEGGFYIAPQNADEIAPVFDMSKSDLAKNLEQILSVDGALIAGDIHEDFATYLYRSRVFAFPDYLSIKVIEIDENQSTIAIYSRLRIGRKDMGVNKARMEAIIDKIS